MCITHYRPTISHPTLRWINCVIHTQPLPISVVFTTYNKTYITYNPHHRGYFNSSSLDLFNYLCHDFTQEKERSANDSNLDGSRNVCHSAETAARDLERRKPSASLWPSGSLPLMSDKCWPRSERYRKLRNWPVMSMLWAACRCPSKVAASPPVTVPVTQRCGLLISCSIVDAAYCWATYLQRSGIPLHRVADHDNDVVMFLDVSALPNDENGWFMMSKTCYVSWSVETFRWDTLEM